MLIALVLLLSTGLLAKDKKGAPENLANIHFTVVKDDNGKPVRNASIVLHPVGKDGTQGRGGYQLKTNGEGEIEDQGVPFGKIRIQVLAHGFQTFGQDYDINQAAMDIEIRLKRPTRTVQHLRQLRTRSQRRWKPAARNASAAASETVTLLRLAVLRAGGDALLLQVFNTLLRLLGVRTLGQDLQILLVVFHGAFQVA